MDDDAPFPPHSQSPAATVGGSLWLVSYADDDDRELTSEQIALALQRGEIELDTIVWRDGMPEWQPIREVRELRAQLKRHAAANAALRKKQTVLGGFHAHDFFPDEAPPPSSAPVKCATSSDSASSGPRSPLPAAPPPPQAASPAPPAASAALDLDAEERAELDSALLQDIPGPAEAPPEAGGDTEETLPLALYRPRQSTLNGTGESPELPPVASASGHAEADPSLDRPSHTSLEDALESLTVDFDPDPDNSGQSSRIRSAVAEEAPSSGVETPRISYPSLEPPAAFTGSNPPASPLDAPGVDPNAARAPTPSSGEDAAPPTIDVRGREPSLSPPPEPATVEAVRFEPTNPPSSAEPAVASKRTRHGWWLVALLVASGAMFLLGRELGQRELTAEAIAAGSAREATSALSAQFDPSAKPPNEASNGSLGSVTAPATSATATPAPEQPAESPTPRGVSPTEGLRGRSTPRRATPPAPPARGAASERRGDSEISRSSAPSPLNEPSARSTPKPASPLKAPATAPTGDSTSAPTASNPVQAPALPEFDTAAAAAALSSAATRASSCREPGDPKGTVLVSVTFSPSGDATRATVEGAPFAGTRTGSCIASKMRAAHVPPFEGTLVTVRKSVVIQ